MNMLQSVNGALKMGIDKFVVQFDEVFTLDGKLLSGQQAYALFVHLQDFGVESFNDDTLYMHDGKTKTWEQFHKARP